jgi:hypothetical protein
MKEQKGGTAFTIEGRRMASLRMQKMGAAVVTLVIIF